MGQCCPKEYVSFEEDAEKQGNKPASPKGEPPSSSTELSSSVPVPLRSHVVVAVDKAPAKVVSEPEKPAAPKPPTPEELAILAARHELETVAARFELPTFDVTEDSKRILLKIGTLTRQARFKTVKRVCVLCNDVFIFANLMDNDELQGKLEMKQVIELSTATLDDRTGGKTRMKHAVCINSPTRNFIVSASCSAEREEWMRLLAQQIVKCQGLPRILLHQGDEDEDGPPQPPLSGRAEKKEDPAAASLHSVLRGTLHSFTLMGEIDNMRLLIKQKKDLDINGRDTEGSTALHVAAQARSVAACEVLLEARGDPTLFNKDGKNVLHLACMKGDINIVNLLLSPDGVATSQGFFPQCTAVGVDKEGNSPLFLAATRCEKPAKVPQLIDALVAAGADVKVKTFPESRTLLHLVAQNGLATAIAPLLAHGASLTAFCNAGRVPLHYASAADCMDTCMAIINAGAAPNRRDRQGNTPLHLAPSLQMAYYLVSVGAQPELTNSQEISALQRFQDHKDTSVLATLNRCTAMFHDSPPVVLAEALPPIAEGTSKVPGCVLCQGMFNLTNLRHSCRKCGLQVCGRCSTKTVTLNKAPPPAARQAIDAIGNLAIGAMDNIAKLGHLPTLGLVATELRVCDGCYNFLRCKQSVTAATHVEADEPEEKPATPVKAEETKATPRTWQDDVSDTLAVSQQNKAILENNLQKLGEMETRAQGLQDSGQQFFDTAHALAQKHRGGKK